MVVCMPCKALGGSAFRGTRACGQLRLMGPSFLQSFLPWALLMMYFPLNFFSPFSCVCIIEGLGESLVARFFPVWGAGIRIETGYYSVIKSDICIYDSWGFFFQKPRPSSYLGFF
jgi:hypothetical protein